MTNTEINEAIAKALESLRSPLSNVHVNYWPEDWATSIDACYRDLLPAVRAKYPRLRYKFEQRTLHTVRATFFLEDAGPSAHADDPDLAVAICLVFLEVMK